MYVALNDKLASVNVLFSIKRNPYLVGQDILIDHCHQVVLKPQYSVIHIYRDEMNIAIDMYWLYN